jgi:hypothetical protein
VSTVRQQGSGSTTPSSAALRFWGGFDGDAPWARKPPCAHGGPTPTPSGVPQGQSCLWHWQVRSSPLLGHCQVQGHGDHRAAQATEAPSNLNLATLELTQQGQSASRGSPRAGLARATMRRRRRACEMAPVPMGHFAARESRARSPPPRPLAQRRTGTRPTDSALLAWRFTRAGSGWPLRPLSGRLMPLGACQWSMVRSVSAICCWWCWRCH